MVKMVTDLYAIDKSMPDNRGALFKKFVDKLLERDRRLAEQVGAAWLDDALIRAGLARIAYTMGHETEMAQEDAKEILRAHLPDIDSDLLLRLSVGANLIEAGESVRFMHQLLQEYFASEILGLDMDSGVDPTRYWKPENWWEPNGREETVIILAGACGDAEAVARWLAPAQPEFAYELLVTSDFKLHPGDIGESTKQIIVDSARAKVDESNPLGRAAAYRVLGLLNADDRTGIGLQTDGLPDIDWVNIPTGRFIYGDSGKGNSSETIDLPAFAIGRYPVTFAQFQAFIDDSEGFSDPQNRWFEGLTADEDDKVIREQAFKYVNHPRETVNWYQAVAFCRWMSWRLGGVYALDAVDQWAVRLPTEFEWEKAARASTEWLYPYGNDFDAMKENTGETGIRQTSAVGIFPLGDTPHWDKPISDLSGNVWEWCLTSYRNPTNQVSTENMRTDIRRIVRGGSWISLQDDVCTTYREDYGLGYRSNFLGFRVARSL